MYLPANAQSPPPLITQVQSEAQILKAPSLWAGYLSPKQGGDRVPIHLSVAASFGSGDPGGIPVDGTILLIIPSDKPNQFTRATFPFRALAKLTESGLLRITSTDLDITIGGPWLRGSWKGNSIELEKQ